MSLILSSFLFSLAVDAITVPQIFHSNAPNKSQNGIHDNADHPRQWQRGHPGLRRNLSHVSFHNSSLSLQSPTNETWTQSAKAIPSSHSSMSTVLSNGFPTLNGPRNGSITSAATLSSAAMYFNGPIPSGLIQDSTTTTCLPGDAKCISLCDNWGAGRACSLSWGDWSYFNLVYSTYVTKTPSISTSYSITTSPWASTYSQVVTDTMSTIISSNGVVVKSLSSYTWTDFYILTSSFIYALDPTAVQTYLVETTMSFPIGAVSSPPSCSYQPCAYQSVEEPITCQPCEVQGGTVQLLYWADLATSSTKSGISTATNSTSNDDMQLTAIYKSHTLTSPTVYIEFQTAFATNACGQNVGSDHPGALISLQPDELYTIQGWYDYFDVTTTLNGIAVATTFYQSATMNYHDLTGPPPGIAYVAQPSCFAYGCLTIYNDYHPVLVLPTQVRDMDPAWKTCGLDWRGAWDPPIPLYPQSSIAAVTTPVSSATSIPASPQSYFNGPATQTAPSAVTFDISSMVAGQHSNLPSSTGDIPNTTQLTNDEGNSHQTLLPFQVSSSSERVTTTIYLPPEPSSVQQSRQSTPQSHDEPSHGPSRSGLEPESAPSPLVIAGQTMSSIVAGVAIGSEKLTAGGAPLTISDTIISVAKSGEIIVVSNSMAPANAYQVLSGAQSYTTLLAASSHSDQGPRNGPDIDKTVLLQPNEKTSISGVGLVSVISNGIVISNGPSATTMPIPSDGTTLLTNLGSYILAGINPEATVTPKSSSTIAAQLSSGDVVVIGEQSLTVGNSITVIEGHTFSAFTGGLIEDGTFISFSTTMAGTTEPPVLTKLPSIATSSPSTSVGDNGAQSKPASGGGSRLEVCRILVCIGTIVLVVVSVK